MDADIDTVIYLPPSISLDLARHGQLSPEPALYKSSAMRAPLLALPALRVIEVRALIGHRVMPNVKTARKAELADFLLAHRDLLPAHLLEGGEGGASGVAGVGGGGTGGDAKQLLTPSQLSSRSDTLALAPADSLSAMATMDERMMRLKRLLHSLVER